MYLNPKIKKMESLAAILKHNQKTFLLTEVSVELKKLAEVEKRVILARTTGLSICQLDEVEVRVVLDNIMLRGAAISGCALPNTEFFANIIGDEILTLLMDYGYEELTEAEILLALRLNAKGNLKYPSGIDVDFIDFFGNCINTAYLSKILSVYMTIRNMLDRKIQNHLDGY